MGNRLSKPEFNQAILNLVNGIIEKDNVLHLKAAKTLESTLTTGNLPRNLEYVTTLFSAISYDVINHPYSASRLYRNLLSKEPLDLSYITNSKINSEKLSNGIIHLGLREYGPFTNNFNDVITDLKRKESVTGELVSPEDSDDYMIFFSLMTFLQKFFMALDKMDRNELPNLLSQANKIHDDLGKFEIKPWLEILSYLYLELIRTINERSIVNLDISEKVKKSFMKFRLRELWPPQMLAVKNGLLEGNNIVYSTPTGTGKSFLAYLSLGKLVPGKQIAYLVPTKSLSAQVIDDVRTMFGDVYNFAISDRDKTSDDDYLDEKDFVVSTYEKNGRAIKTQKN